MKTAKRANSSKKAAKARSANGSGPRIVSKAMVRKLRDSGASDELIEAAERAIRTNPA